MLKSDIIFWSTIFFVFSWLIGFYLGLPRMIAIWLGGATGIITITLLEKYFNYLKRFDKW